MAAPSNATPAYSNAGYEQPYYHHDPFWSGQPPVGYNLPPLTDLANASAASSSSSSYEAPDPMQSMYYTMPQSYYMPSLAASMTSYADPAALAAAAAASSYAAPAPPGDAPHPLNNFYLQQQQQPSAPVPISQSMMTTTPSYAMPTQISPPTPHYDYTTVGYSPAAGGMGIRTSSTGQLQQSTSAAAAPPPVPAAAVKKKCGKKPKVEASPVRSAGGGDSEDFDENEGEDDHDRRKLNNIRERVRVKDINNAFHELGHMVNQFDNAGVTMEKQQTKLGILHNAVELIKNLEEQVKRRNLARNMANGALPAGPPQKPFPPNLQVPPNC
ncbi:hlh-2 [Pristionchus pacificus]|uniref:Hlh-2 n=1 Tax=Pristionchus pacificus TaxID=54126 RepID=A0A454XS22_PRIPA|nr:hlh-2 [Pristionchus pacificus]|eukprot:PDM68963.1 hlh-2 [Pristionchus pacificus]